MDKLKSGQIEEALGMLYMSGEGNALQPLSDEMKKNLKRRFTFFPVKSYVLEYFLFSDENTNDVKYAVKFTEGEKGNASDITAFMFNPVRKEGKWYLTVKQGTQELSK